MPDINGSRKILDLYTKNIFDIECTDAANTKELLTVVGRFHFYTDAFEKANAIVLAALNERPGWLVIDEAGKLELRVHFLDELFVGHARPPLLARF